MTEGPTSQPQSESSEPNPAPGWYPNPAGEGTRYWDGRAWAPETSTPGWGATTPPPATPGGSGAPLPLGPQEERNWALWAHLGALLVFLAGFATAGALSLFAFVVPLVIMQSYGPRSAYVRQHAVESLNFQLSWLLYGLILIVGSVLIAVVTLGIGLLGIIPLLLVAFVCELVFMIMACTAASAGRLHRYPLTIRFVS